MAEGSEDYANQFCVISGWGRLSKFFIALYGENMNII